MKHNCVKMQRASEIQTKTGATAYGLYKLWLEKQRRKPPPIETFMTSMHYGSFIKFTTWWAELGIPDPTMFVDLMVKNGITPVLWRRPEMYQLYHEYMDVHADPYEQVVISIDTILVIAEGLDITPSEVFKAFTAGEIIELILQKRLSPWVLFCSKSFKEWVEALHEADRSVVFETIGIKFWTEKINNSPDIIKDIKIMTNELGI